MKFGEVKKLISDRDTTVLKVVDRIVENIAFDLGYRVEYYDRGYDVDSWMEDTFGYYIGEYISLADGDDVLSENGIDIWSYFDKYEVVSISMEYVQDIGEASLVIALGW